MSTLGAPFVFCRAATCSKQSPSAPPWRFGNDSVCAPRPPSYLPVSVLSLSLSLSLSVSQCGPAGHGQANGNGNGNGEDDVVLFVGSGTTAAVAKLVSALGLDRKKSRFSRSNNT